MSVLIKELSLRERTFSCECGLRIDRDLSAAIKIKTEELRIFSLEGRPP
jgi:transposase